MGNKQQRTATPLSKDIFEFTLTYTDSKFKSKADFIKRYEIKNTIGEGGQAYVKQAFDSVELEYVALKIFKKEQMNLFAVNAANLEYNIMNSLGHDNILKSKCYFEDSEYIIIVNELLSTDLKSLLQTMQAPLTEDYIKTIFH